MSFTCLYCAAGITVENGAQEACKTSLLKNGF